MAKNTTADKRLPNPELADIWPAVFDPYRDHPKTALVLAQNLRLLQQTLQGGKDGAQQVIAALECGIEHLFKHSEFCLAGRKLFRLAVAGNLRPDISLTKLAETVDAHVKARRTKRT